MNPVDYGQLCAVATAGQRDLHRCVSSYPGLFPESLFGQTLFSTLAFAMAFSAPGVPADRLRTSIRAGLWNFAVDSLMDTHARTPAEAAEITRRCLDAARGEAPGCDATRLLAEIRADLATSPSFAALETRWREELRRMLDAMVREREWVDAPPSFDEYLPTAAASVGFSFVFLSHWISTGDDVAGADEVIEAARQVEPVLRLINDLGTHQRDSADGDLNALQLGVSHAELTARLEDLMAELNLDPVRRSHPELAEFLDRQVGFNLGFYRTADYRAAG